MNLREEIADIIDPHKTSIFPEVNSKVFKGYRRRDLSKADNIISLLNKQLEGITIEEKCSFCKNRKTFIPCPDCKGTGYIERPATIQDITKENIKNGRLKCI